MAASPPDTKIALVEKGLRPANSFKGDPTWSLEERMEHYGVPGVSIAVIHNYKIVWHRVYGVADRTTGEPVRRDTLFQAGSISKPVSAFGALKMVDR
ncbi:MAG: serine hydrolase domain-containing protein, partial [Dehalococcoidia bacterium]